MNRFLTQSWLLLAHSRAHAEGPERLLQQPLPYLTPPTAPGTSLKSSEGACQERKQSAPTCSAMPWQSPGTSPKPSLKALQEAPHHLAVNPRARETENHPVILPMHGRAEVPTCVRLQSMLPTSGPEPLTLCSSACAFGSGT